MELNKLSNDELIFEVQNFQREHSENLVCADCKTPDPRWASYNLGCFLCLRCSGIHRSLGTHISKVKSIDLDTWTAEQVQSMLDRGNKICNDYWEANLPKNYLPPQSNLEAWIQSKYVFKKYLNENNNNNDQEEEEGSSKKDHYSDLNSIKFETGNGKTSTNNTNNANNNNNEKIIKPKNDDKPNINLLKGFQYFNICDSDNENENDDDDGY